MSGVIQLIGEAMRRPAPSVTPSTTIAEIEGWDSIMTVRLLLLIEQKLGRELGEDELSAIEIVDDIEQLIGRSQRRE